MKVEKIQSYYFINTVKEHKLYKDKILKSINEIPKNSFEFISHTDWTLPQNYNREYIKLFYAMINPYLENIKEFINVSNYEIHNTWFQQYEKNDRHDFHTHGGCQYTNVYYLEMPEENMKTKLFEPLEKKIIDIDIKEGDLITFASYINHKSDTNKSDKRKTVISFNSSFGDIPNA